MKKGYIREWTNIDECKNLLFFAQLVNELLFDYSIPSNRISTLNSHYLCVDALNAISGIDFNGVPEGTMKPIMEELYNTLSKDVLFSLCDESPLKYFIKYQNEGYRLSTNTKELNYEESKRVVSTLVKKYFSDLWYVNELKNKITDIIKANKENDQLVLFRLTKSLLTELINGGYSSSYIFERMQQCFFYRDRSINSPNQIDDFLTSFDFKKHRYKVVFVIIEEQLRLISLFDDISIIDSYGPHTDTQKERRFLNKSEGDKYLILETDTLDPYSAAENRKNMLRDNAAFYRMCDHNYEFNIHQIKCGVYSQDNYFTYIKNVKSAVHKSKTLSIAQISNFMQNVENAINSVATPKHASEFLSLINAARFHSLSLDTVSEQNQLLDLWAIFETILDISNKHTSDRIQQICIYLVPILKRRYIYSLFLQLASDIKNYSPTKYMEIIKDSANEYSIVKNICEYVILSEHKSDRDAFLSTCHDFPLLIERVLYYNDMLSSPHKVYKFVEKHAERVKWQVMRIYRNRNLIIHNGKSMPYLNLLIENLHSYVDDFLNYVILCLSKGHSLSSMSQELFAKECEWLDIMGNKKAVMTINTIETMLQQ